MNVTSKELEVKAICGCIFSITADNYGQDLKSPPYRFFADKKVICSLHQDLLIDSIKYRVVKNAVSSLEQELDRLSPQPMKKEESEIVE